MNQKVYNKVCRKIGHNWAFKDCDMFMLKICMDCGCKQMFLPEEVDWDADVGHDYRQED